MWKHHKAHSNATGTAKKKKEVVGTVGKKAKKGNIDVRIRPDLQSEEHQQRKRRKKRKMRKKKKEEKKHISSESKIGRLTMSKNT